MKKKLFCALAGGILLLGFYMRWEGGHVVVRQDTLAITGIKAPIRLLHISDLHYKALAGVTLDYIRHVVDVAAAQKPDVILITGDFIFDHCKYPREYAAVLARLAQTAPTYACFGNHDGGRWASAIGGYPDLQMVTSILRDAGIHPLVNAGETVHCGTNSLEIIGVGDVWSGNFYPQAAFQKMAPQMHPRILLSHNPNSYARLKNFSWNLMLSGHTHGGQACIPILGSPWAPVDDKSYLGGLKIRDGHCQYISRGIGGIFRMRFNCPPEINVLTLMPVGA